MEKRELNRLIYNNKLDELSNITNISDLTRYEYLGKYGDCVDLNTLDNTYYVYPECEEFSVTKFSLATEELYKYWINKKKDA